MRYKVYGTAVLEADVEAPNADIAWERLRQHAINLREPFSNNVDNFKISTIEVDEIEETDDIIEDEPEFEDD